MWGKFSSGEDSPGFEFPKACQFSYKYKLAKPDYGPRVKQRRTFWVNLYLPYLNMTSDTQASNKPDDTKPKADKNDVWVENSQEENPNDVMSIYLSYDAEYRQQVELQLRRKVDTRILPLIVLIYLLNYLDRNSITQARLYGLQEDTGVKGAQYQTAISIFSAGYILMQLPSTVLMTKFRPSIFLVCTGSG